MVKMKKGFLKKTGCILISASIISFGWTCLGSHISHAEEDTVAEPVVDTPAAVVDTPAPAADLGASLGSISLMSVPGENGATYSDDGTVLESVVNASGNTFVVPGNVTSIAAGAFDDSGVYDLHFANPGGITTIGDQSAWLEAMRGSGQVLNIIGDDAEGSGENSYLEGYFLPYNDSVSGNIVHFYWGGYTPDDPSPSASPEPSPSADPGTSPSPGPGPGPGPAPGPGGGGDSGGGGSSGGGGGGGSYVPPAQAQAKPTKTTTTVTYTVASDGSISAGHTKDTTPTTADGFDPRYLLCIGLFLLGAGTIVMGRQHRLEALALREREEY